MLKCATAAESILAGYSNFRSVVGTAEATTLADSSVDFVVAGQAFHWFDPVRSKDRVQANPEAGWLGRSHLE